MPPISATVPTRTVPARTIITPTAARAAPAARATFTPSGTFTGYASLFCVEDQGRDIVMPGAFRTSLNQRGAVNIRLLFQHDPAQPIGAWDEIREDACGLFVRGHLIEDAPSAREILALLRGGAVDGLSIGFRARRAQRDARTGQRRLYDIDLWEISIVTFPMLPGARVNAVKSATGESVVGRDQTSIAAFPLTRLRPAVTSPSSTAAPRNGSSTHRRPSRERRGARPGEGVPSV